jgi:hypothetical protein
MNYERELKDALAKVLAKNEELMARVGSLETELSKARGDGSGEIGVAKGARHTSLRRRGYNAGDRISKAHAAKDDPVRKQRQSEIGIAKAAIQHGRVRGR